MKIHRQITATLLFVSFVIFAIASASVQKNLRFLEENERELEGESSPEVDESSQSATTEPATPSASPSPSDQSDSSSSSNEPGGGSDSSSGSSEPSGGSDKSDETSSSSGGSSGSDAPVTPTIPDNKLGCYFESPKYPELKEGKFEFKEILCNLPPEADESTSTPETTTTPAAARVLDEVKITIDGKESNACTKPDQTKDNLYKCPFSTEAGKFPSVAKSTVDFTWGGNTTTIYLGCNMGSKLHKANEKINTEQICDINVFAEGNYTGECVVEVDTANNKQVMKLDLGGEDSYTGCNCTVEWNGGKSGNDAKKIPTDADNKVDGAIYGDFKPCKGGKVMRIQCTANGWKDVDGTTETGSCQWDNGAISSTVSSILLVLAVVFSIVL